MLAKDHHVFTPSFPANKSNLNDILDALKTYPKCFDAKSNSYSLDKIAEWVIRKLEAFRQARIAGKPTAEPSPLDEETQYVVPEVEAMRARLRSEEAEVGPATERMKAIRIPRDDETTTDLPQSITGAPPGVPVSTGPLPADEDEYPTFQGLLAAEKAEYRIIELTRQNHKLNKQNSRIEGELRLLTDSISMLASTLGIEYKDTESLDSFVERVAGISAVEQNLADVIGAFPPDVLETLEPGWADKDILTTLRRAVSALLERTNRGVRDVSSAREDAAKIERKWEDAEQDLTVQRLQLLAENEELRTQMQDAEGDLTQARTEQREVEAIADQRALSSQGKIAEVQEKYEHLNMNYLLLESDIERVKLERDKAIGMIEESKGELDARVRQLEGLRERLNVTEADLVDAEAGGREKADEAEARGREIDDFREKFEGLEQDVEELTQANEKLETTIREKDDEAETLRSRIEEMQ